MKLRLKAGERLYINGAVLRFENRTSLEFLNDVYFLLERQIMQPEEVKSDIDRLYFLVQLLVIEPHQVHHNVEQFKTELAAQLNASEGDLRFELHDVGTLVLERRYHEAMKRLKKIAAQNGQGSQGEGSQGERKVA
ncbi:MAG: flagellar biosynthesis repressor FlbT [Ahrensia sp.]|nr:flagellar biosynthesis repressor FlbT [Ahrensia sp.]